MTVLKETYNVLPRISFRWVKANELVLNAIDVDESKSYRYGKLNGENIRQLENQDLPMSENFKGVNQRMLTMANTRHNAGIFMALKENEERDVYIEHLLTEENDTLIEKNVFVLERGAKLNVIMDYQSDDAMTFSNVLNKAQVAEGAELNIVKIQRLNAISHHFESRYSTVGEGGKVNFVSVEIGGKNAVVNYMTDLNGDGAEGHVKSAYLGFGDRVLDLSHHMNHYGKKTNSDMIFKGALRDRSKKAFRGTLDFKNGSTHSEGNEEEFTILLNPKVKAFSIPLLLCREDDVIGNHAASNGQIDKEKLFYIMSRGFSEEEAKKIIIESHIRPIVDLIPVDAIREDVLESIDREMLGA